MKELKENLKYYDLMRTCPKECMREIKGGDLKGFSDINPMWRIEKMTELFGMCGFGWKYEITKQWNEQYANEVKTYCNINLYVKMNGEWSDAIQGTGGSSFVRTSKDGLRVSDENYKMALTDALSVAMKALGMAADVYLDKQVAYETKYSKPIDNIKPVKYETPKPAQPVAQPIQQAKPAPVVTSQTATGDLFDEADNEQMNLQFAKDELAQANTKEELLAVVNRYPMLRGNAKFLAAGTARKEALGIQ